MVYKENEVSNASSSNKTDKNKKDQNRNKEMKSVLIIGGRMMKHLNVWDMFKKVYKSECKIYIKSFSGGKTSCMEDYVKPSLRSKTNHLILHIGKNDLNPNKTSEVIAKRLLTLQLH